MGRNCSCMNFGNKNQNIEKDEVRWKNQEEEEEVEERERFYEYKELIFAVLAVLTFCR